VVSLHSFTTMYPGWRGFVCLKPHLLFPLGKSPWYTLNRRHRIEAIIFKITEAHTYAMAVSSEIPIHDNTPTILVFK